jgi:hypothetical protein
MAKLIFKYTDDLLKECREASQIELTIPDDFNIHEYKIICTRLASAIGFAESTIKNSFGENVYDSDLDIHFQDFLKSALNYSSSYEF